MNRRKFLNTISVIGGGLILPQIPDYIYELKSTKNTYKTLYYNLYNFGQSSAAIIRDAIDIVANYMFNPIVLQNAYDLASYSYINTNYWKYCNMYQQRIIGKWEFLKWQLNTIYRFNKVPPIHIHGYVKKNQYSGHAKVGKVNFYFCTSCHR